MLLFYGTSKHFILHKMYPYFCFSIKQIQIKDKVNKSRNMTFLIGKPNIFKHNMPTFKKYLKDKKRNVFYLFFSQALPISTCNFFLQNTGWLFYRNICESNLPLCKQASPWSYIFYNCQSLFT